MESRSAQDGGAVRRSGAFSGRQVPLEMGTLRVGGSGRPVPAVFSSGAARRSVTASLEAPAASATALSPRLTVEPHPRSPFRRREELSKTVVRSRDDSSRSRFQVKKVTGPYPLSARSPQIRSKGTRKMMNESATRSHEMRTSRSSGIDALASGEDAYDERVEQSVWKTQPRGRGVQEDMQVEGKQRSTHGGETLPAADIMPIGETTTWHVGERTYPDPGKTSELRPKVLPLSVASPGAGTFVSSMPSLTKLRSSFTARELVLFTQRQEATEVDSHARYHVASHPNSTAVAISSATFQTNQERIQEKPNGHKRELSSHVSRRDNEQVSVNEKRRVESSWTRVDTSIDHIYEDPATDIVQLHLLHSHHASTGQKKRKMVERKRVLTAASGLREHRNEMQRQQEQLRQRKLQVQKMSEAIRQQNQRAVQARAVRSGGMSDRRRKASQRAESAPNLPERKPPVPRLSRNTSTAKQQKRKKKPKEQPRLQGVSTSILMGLPLGSSTEVSHKDLSMNNEGEGDEEDAVVSDEISKPPVEQQTNKRRPLASTPRVSKREKRIATALPSGNDAAIRAKEERRAIAREYMQLQKTSRRIWNAKAKEQYQREQEKRQQQLEILEATRLQKLRLSKKRADGHKNQELVDPVLSDDVAMETIAMSISPENSSDLRGSAIDTFSKREINAEASRRDEKIIFDEPHQDNENDRAIGNLKGSERSERVTRYDTFLASGAEETKNMLVMREEGSQASERVRKLLELREKTAALSARLSGLRKQPGTSTEVLVVEEESQYESIDLSANGVARPTSGVNGSQTPADTPVVNAVDRFASQSGSDYDDVEYSKNDDSDRVEEVDEGSIDSFDVGGKLHDGMESRNGSSKAEEDKDDLDGSENGETLVRPPARSRQVVQQIQAFNSTSDTFEEDVDIDIRSIGVYNISVVWPSPNEVMEGISEAKCSFESQKVSSSSLSSSSASSSPRDSPRIVQRDLFAGQLDDSHDEFKRDLEEVFEVKFYEQLENRLQSSTTDNDESKPTPNRSSRVESDEAERYGSDSDSDLPVQTLQSGLSLGTGINPVSANQPSRPNAGLLKLIRETDDSLSVIDRVAKSLYREQLERSEREKERELQVRIEAEKKKLIEKDLALKAVMESLTGRRASDDDSGESNSEDGDLQSEDDNTEFQAAQYKRLEEIMDEVEKERSQENKEISNSPRVVPRSDNRDRKITRGQTEDLRSDESFQSRGRVPVSTSSSGFWDQLVSGSAPHDIDVGHLNTNRPHVAVDDSELVAQREARLREDDENRADYTDSPPRIHSPRTLSKRLMAAVDYQEAIFEAHMQLAIMEHTHELETVQAETITLAQAFKEEMEDNASTHRLALDHATLEKKFDDDIQDVMQQLTTIRQTEEQERTAQESHMEQQLRQANLRECSVQTEVLQRADAATSAAFYVDTSTSPVRFVSDAAVQHDTIELTTEASALANSAIGEDELEYASDENAVLYEETFEKESQLEVDAQTYNKRNASDISSIAESVTRSRLQSEGSEESEIHSVLSDPDIIADDDTIVKSGVTNRIGSEGNSVADDEEYEDEVSNTPASEHAVSASIDYEEDFDTSSPTVKSARERDNTVEDDVEDDAPVQSVSAVEEYPVEHDTLDDGALGNAGDDDKGAYSEEGFDNSVADDEEYEDEVSNTPASEHAVSASIDYEEDFDTSSPTVKSARERDNTVEDDVEDDAPVQSVSAVEEYPVEHDTPDDGALGNAGDDDQDAYSEEGFDSASGSISNEEPPPITASIAPSSIYDTSPTASAWVKEEELTQVIDGTMEQLHDDKPVNELNYEPAQHNASTQYAAEESQSLLTSASISISHDSEEEVLTKSIEERTTRLQELRLKIANRKGEIRAVQKQMRVEKRKEQLTEEEKLLWNELESVEKLLRADEAALELCRQRNRLEMMNLQARQLIHASRKEHTLLDGYNYVEDTEPSDNPTNPSVRDRETADRVFVDLLDGYNYVEDAEPIDNHTNPTVAQDIEPAVDFLDGNNYDEDTKTIDSHTNLTVARDRDTAADLFDGNNYFEDTEPIDNHTNPTVARDRETADRVFPDLLDGYNYVEDAESIDNDTDPTAVQDVETADQVFPDLLDRNNYVEDTEPIDNHTNPTVARDRETADRVFPDLLDGYNYVEDAERIDNDTDPTVAQDVETADQGFSDLLDRNNYVEDTESIDNYANPTAVQDVETVDQVSPDLLDGNNYVEDTEAIGNHTNPTVARDRETADQVFPDLLDRNNYVEDTESIDSHTNPTRDRETADQVADLLDGYNYVEDTEPIDNHVNPIVEDTEPETTSGAGTDLNKAAKSERVADEIFSTVYDDIVNSELRIWSCRRLSASTESSPQSSVTSTNASALITSAKVGITLESVNRVADQNSRARDLNITQQLVDRLEVVHGEIRLPERQGSLENGPMSATPAAHALYDTVKALARSCFNAVLQTSAGERPLDQTIILEVVRRHVEAEINELLEIREQSEHELERQLQLLSDETGAEDGFNGDLLLSQNCIASNVSSIVSKVQSDLSRTTEELSSAVQPSRSGIFPRTPTSRARSTSILSSLQTQQDQELQQRLTAMILGDLLHDAGLP